jgi:hypothetical protein
LEYFDDTIQAGHTKPCGSKKENVCSCNTTNMNEKIRKIKKRKTENRKTGYMACPPRPALHAFMH